MSLQPYLDRPITWQEYDFQSNNPGYARCTPFETYLWYEIYL
jgi:hypothetical protein